ncbi:hypothetical protein K470DRAFT_269347 [Piedraia hortae CBS 480.64]|uniref:Uncharacterized protein n=1 Tax=Piedraia hortae CBS 480.64 TaxID=1314780 RepID=A0A6A7C5V4_9PEZI|nr:hypothetical protein K470DRAFT_269347 [Piedraia hortae CBS 480.64]
MLPTESALAPFTPEERTFMSLAWLFADVIPEFNINAIAHFKRKQVADVRRAWDDLVGRITAQKAAIEKQVEEDKLVAQANRATKRKAKKEAKKQVTEKKKKKQAAQAAVVKGAARGKADATKTTTTSTTSTKSQGNTEKGKNGVHGKKRAAEAANGGVNKKSKHK